MRQGRLGFILKSTSDTHLISSESPKATSGKLHSKPDMARSKVMLFGLTNGPAVFQHFMNDVFGDMLDVCVVMYLNDILIYSDDLAKHREHVREVLQHLRKHGLYATANKCEWHWDSVEFLISMLLADGFTLSVNKDWPEPWKVTDIQSFLGFANFYRRFIYNHSNITVPLTRLTRKGTPWVFTKECWESFNYLKKAFTLAPILSHWVPDRPMVLETDASDYALGTILSLFDDEGVLHPVAFHSWTFTCAELN
jgi:RNase H-like domain found in reverse transcriptase/Reverse transcriptase (RNA-dependent DNA polymerase)